MKNIKKVSSMLIIVFRSLLIGLPLIKLLFWIGIGTAAGTAAGTVWINKSNSLDFFVSPISTPEGMVDLAAIHWTLGTALIALFANLISLLPFLIGMMLLIQIFNRYLVGEIFSVANATRYQRLGWLFFLNAFITLPLSDTLMTLVATLGNPVGHRYLTLSFGTDELQVVFYGLLVIVISWVMREGARINEEQRLTI